MGCPDAAALGYELTANLDFDENDCYGSITAADAAYWNGGAGWEPIGDDPSWFTATFEGNNNTIANCSSAGAARTIWDCSPGSRRPPSATWPHRRQRYGRRPFRRPGRRTHDKNSTSTVISNVSVSGNVSWAASDWIGMLVGQTTGAATISRYSPMSGSVSGGGSGSDKIGALVGHTDDTTSISGASASANVTNGGDDLGGLVGDNEGAISGSYASGA